MKAIISVLLLLFASTSSADEWKELGKKLVTEYDGTILAVEQLDASVCRVVVAPSLSNNDCVATAENIGYFIRNATSGAQGVKPVVHVSRKGRQIAVAHPSSLGYAGEIQIRDSGVSGSGGDY